MPTWVDDVLADPSMQQHQPQRPWQTALIEENVLFLHYRFTSAELRSLVPSQLELVTYDGSVWVSLIALHVSDVKFRRSPMPLPRRWRNFGEIDVAVNVQFQGRRGLYFLSIEGADRFASWVTRRSSGIPYLYSPNLDVRPEGDGFRAISGPRWVRSRPAAEFEALYAARKPVRAADPGSPVHSLAGQYSAFAVRRGKVYELDEIHRAWDLLEADVELRKNALLGAAGIGGEHQPELQHFSPGSRIVAWLPRQVREGRAGLAPVDPSPS